MKADVRPTDAVANACDDARVVGRLFASSPPLPLSHRRRGRPSVWIAQAHPSRYPIGVGQTLGLDRCAQEGEESAALTQPIKSMISDLLAVFASMRVSRIRKLDPGRFERDLIEAQHTVETFAKLSRGLDE